MNISKVQKFGGTSVGSANRIKALSAIIEKNEPVIVVLSAMSGTTNALVDIASKHAFGKIKDAKTAISALKLKYVHEMADLFSEKKYAEQAKEYISELFERLVEIVDGHYSMSKEKEMLAMGELMSTHLFHYYLDEIGVKSVLLPALDFMRIDGEEEPDLEFIRTHLNALLTSYSNDCLFITQGYICRNVLGDIDNLKRGGSDYTASLIGAAIRVNQIEIWTDIDGMHNNDPRIVDKTFPIHELTFNEAAELAYFGAKILHPTCILPAMKENIPVLLLNTMQPEARGTVISQRASGTGIKAVAAKDGIIAVNIKSMRMLLAYGFLRHVFEIFEKYKTSIDMVTTSEVAVSLTIDQDAYLNEIVRELSAFSEVEIDRDQTIICVVGDLSAEKSGYAGKVLDALKTVPIRMISYGGSENNMSVLVNTTHKKEALQALNNGLFSKQTELV